MLALHESNNYQIGLIWYIKILTRLRDWRKKKTTEKTFSFLALDVISFDLIAYTFAAKLEF